MPTRASSLIRRIHASPLGMVLATTGGGASALDQLLAVPGGSRTVLEGIVPYSAPALRQFLGAAPEHYCSPETARAMAMAAFQRALDFSRAETRPDDSPATESVLAGVACTASLASDRPKKGAHRAHLAAQTAAATVTQSIELTKGCRTRYAEEKLLGRLLLNLIAQTAGLDDRLLLSLLPGEQVDSSQTGAPPEWTRLLLGESRAARHGPAVPTAGRRVIFPGAFHPRHAGHRRLAEVALRRLGAPIEHEIAIVNVDKPPLDFTEMQRRLEHFTPDETLWFTRAPRFEQKADLFPGATFLVGVDTIVRVGEPRYYGGDPQARDRALSHLAERGCRFLVFGRQMDGRFRGLADIDLPAALAALSEGIPCEEFRADVSSRELRRGQGPKDRDEETGSRSQETGSRSQESTSVVEFPP